MSLRVRYGERTQTGYQSGSLSLDWVCFGDDPLCEVSYCVRRMFLRFCFWRNGFCLYDGERIIVL